MSQALFFEFKGVTAHEYRAVNAILKLDPATGDGAWPIGLLSHTGAVGPDGDFILFEVWDSQDSQAAWMASRFGPALIAAGVPEPHRVEWLSVVGHYDS